MDSQSQSSGKAMDWMYKGPTALVDREDYLLGRKVDKSFQQLEAQEKGEEFSYANEVEKDLTPASIFTNKGGHAAPVDLIRKIKEDPLYQIEKKEQETLKQLLQNPIKMKQLQKLAEQKKNNSSKSDKSKKKKHKKKKNSSSSDSDSDCDKLDKSTIDKLLAAKLSALKKKSKSKKRDRSSSSSSSSSSSEDSDQKHKSSRSKHNSSSSGSRVRERSPTDRNQRDMSYKNYRDRDNSSRGRRDDRGRRDGYERHQDYRSDSYRSSSSRHYGDRGSQRPEPRKLRSRSRSPRRYNSARDGPSSSKSFETAKKDYPQRRKPLSEEEMERRRREMMDNAKLEEEDRKKNIERWKEEQRKEEEEHAKEHKSDFIRKHLLSAAESGSVEKRLKSNSYNLQKSYSSMSQNFARR